MSIIGEFSDGLAEAAKTGGASTVLVDARRRSPASGVAFAADLVITADHVITRDDSIHVETGEGRTIDASVAGRDPGSDLALLRLSEGALTPARVASVEARVGQLVLALGRPAPSGLRASWGIVVAIGGPTRTGRGGLLEQFLQTETTPYPGFSGGPLVDTDGAVLGINTSGLTPGSSLTIPTGMAWRVAAALARDGTVRRAYLGVRTQVAEVPETARGSLHTGQEHGLLISWLEDKGPAQRAGLMVGDILVAIGGKQVSESDDLFAALSSETVGKLIAVDVVRGGKVQSLQVTVGDRK